MTSAVSSLRTIRQWCAVFSIFFQEGLAYRAAAIVWILTDLFTAVVMPNVWAAASASQGGTVGGYSKSDFALYYVTMLLVGNFVTSHILWEIAEDIKEGRFSNQLLRPFSFIQYTFFRSLAWRVMRTFFFIPLFLALAFAYRNMIGQPTINLGIEFWVALVMGHLVSFMSVFMFGLLALFIEEAYSVFELYYGPMLFFSGRLFPVSIMPDWAAKIAEFTPFYYTVGVPTEILIGRIDSARAWPLIGVQFFWIVACWLGARFLWTRGLKHYSGVGM